MNHTHRIIYSRHSDSYVVVAEIVKCQGKTKSIYISARPATLSKGRATFTSRLKAWCVPFSVMGMLSVFSLPMAHASYVHSDASANMSNAGAATEPTTAQADISSADSGHQMASNRLLSTVAVTTLSNTLSQNMFTISANGQSNAVAVAEGDNIDFSSRDNNVVIAQNGSDLTFGLANAVAINQSLTVASKVTINSDGTISNVANAVSSSDAVNKQQLDAASTRFVSINSNNTSALNYDNKGAEGNSSIAIGPSAQAIGTASIALGNTAKTLNDQAVAIGNGAQANKQSIAIGGNAGMQATGTNNVFIGYNTRAADGTGNYNTVLGSNAFYNGSGQQNTYLGAYAGNQYLGSDNTAVGYYAGVVGKGNQNASLGHQAGYNVSGNSNASFGYTAGYGVKGDYNVATGYTSGRSIQGHYNVVSGSYAGSSLSGNHNVVSGTYAAISMSGSNNLVMGYAAAIENFNENYLTGLPTTASNAVILGAKAYVKSDNSVALGANSVALTAVGTNAMSIAGGTYAVAGGSPVGSVSIGSAGKERTLTNVAAGRVVNGSTDAINGSQLYAVTVAIDGLAAGGTANTVIYDSNTKDRITLAGSGNGTLITHLQDGSVSATSTDAINGRQLYQGVSSVANALGGGAVVNANGTLSAPNYVLDGKTHTNVGSALSDLDGRVVTNTQNIAQNSQNINHLSNTISQGTFSVSANGPSNAVLIGQGDTIDLSSSDNNVIISQNGSNLRFGLANQLNIGGGIKIANTVSITATGVDVGGTTLTGLLDGLNANDAVTKSQLDTVAQRANALSALAVTYDSTTKDRITLAGGSTGTLITHLQDGFVSAISTDAINGRQLYQGVSSVANALGGGAVVNADGILVAPSYVLNGQTFANVNGALVNLDSRVIQNTRQVQNLDTRVNHIDTQVQNMQTQLNHTTGNMVQYDDTTKDRVTLAGTLAQVSHNSQGDEIVISGGTLIQNVANGIKASDAINKGQLDAGLSEAKSYTDTQISKFSDTLGADLSELKTNLETTQTHLNDVQNGAAGMVRVSQNVPVQAPEVKGSNALAIGSGALAHGENAVAIGNQSLNESNNSVALGTGSIANRDNTVSIGSQGQERQLTNVAAGTQATDAVNVGQMNHALTSIGNQFNHLNQRIHEVEDNANAGIAAAIAISNLPQPSNPGEGWVSMAIGGYDNQSGYAVGYSASSINGRWNFKAAATGNSQGKLGAGAGVAFRLY